MDFMPRWDAPGYPACAGIDRPSFFLSLATRGLPRMRGDRPVPKSFVFFCRLATPHARGSTPARSMPAAVTFGYPACAGIDLT